MTLRLCPGLSLDGNTKSKPSVWISRRVVGVSLLRKNSQPKSLDWRHIRAAHVDGDDSNTLRVDDNQKRLAGAKPYSGVGKEDFMHPLATEEGKSLNHMNCRMEQLIGEIKSMFHLMEDGEISPSAYDTAWVARVPAMDDGSQQPQFPQTLQWILDNQLPDGSWGEASRFLACDRLLNTLACLFTLTLWSTGNTQVQRGIDFIRRHSQEIMIKKAVGYHGKGFHMLFPAMLNEAKLLGLDLPIYELSNIKQMHEKRDSYLNKIYVERLHNHPTEMLCYLEGIQEVVDWKSILTLQSKDGSFVGSPASTACVFMHTGDQKCLEFLTGLVTKFQDHVPCMYPVDIAERLRTVDTIESLGLERHFQLEIKQALDYVFRHWGERGIGFGRDSIVPDIDVTATGFRLLRTYGYSVTSDVLENINGEAEEHHKYSGEEKRGLLSDTLSLYRCSQVNFPGEKVMREISAFAENYLAKSLQNNDYSQAQIVKKNLRKEIEYALRYRWNRNQPLLMYRNQIEQFNPNDLCLWKTLYQLPNANNKKYSELAKLDFNSVQALYRSEIQQITRWKTESGFPQLTFTFDRREQIYFSAAVVISEPQYSACRIAYAKAATLTVILDDLYDSYASLHQVDLFNEAVRRWDPSVTENLPDDMKICFMGLYNTLNDIGEQASKAQGRDVLPYLRTIWEVLLEAYTEETKWAEAKYTPSLKEYWKNAIVSIALGAVALSAIFSTGELLEENIVEQLDFRSEFLILVSFTGRLINDLRTFEVERDRGEVASSI